MEHNRPCTACFLLSLAVGALTFGAQALAQQHSKPRVFISDSESWQLSGRFGGSKEGVGGSVKGGARPQRAEIIKTFGDRCPAVTVTLKQEVADYVVLLDHEGGKDLAQRRNKVAVFNKDGDSIFSKSTRSLGNAVKDACAAILYSPASAERALALPSNQPVSTLGDPAPDNSPVTVKSSPDGADITVDGKFVGSTPSTLRLAPGQHTISIEKPGFRPWKRTITLSAGGNVTVEAALEKTP